MTSRLIQAVLLSTVVSACGGGGNGGTNVTDTLPDAFTLPAVTNAELSKSYLSQPVIIAGIDTEVTLSVSGCSYSRNNSGEFVTENSTVNNSDTLIFKIDSAPRYDESKVCYLKVGDYQTNFIVSTLSENITASFYFPPPYNDVNGIRQAVPITKAFTHTTDGSEIKEILDFNGNSVSFSREENKSIALTAYFELIIDNTRYVRLMTITGLHENNDHYLQPISEDNSLNTNCKHIELSSVNTNFESSNHWIGVYSPNFCGQYIGTSSAGGSIDFDIQKNISATIKNDILAYTSDSDVNLTGYTFLSSSDLEDGDVLSLTTLQTNFDIIQITNTSNSDANVSVTGEHPDFSPFRFRIGNINLSSENSPQAMNVIGNPFSNYRVSIINSDYDPNTEIFQWMSESFTYEQLPSELFVDSILGRYTHLEVLFEESINISWATENFPNDSGAYMNISGTTYKGYPLDWIVASPPTNQLSLPDLSAYGVDLIDVTQGGDFFLSVSRLNEDESSFSAYLAAPISCNYNLCNLTADF